MYSYWTHGNYSEMNGFEYCNLPFHQCHCSFSIHWKWLECGFSKWHPDQQNMPTVITFLSLLTKLSCNSSWHLLPSVDTWHAIAVCDQMKCIRPLWLERHTTQSIWHCWWKRQCYKNIHTTINLFNTEGPIWSNFLLLMQLQFYLSLHHAVIIQLCWYVSGGLGCMIHNCPLSDPVSFRFVWISVLNIQIHLVTDAFTAHWCCCSFKQDKHACTHAHTYKSTISRIRLFSSTCKEPACLSHRPHLFNQSLSSILFYARYVLLILSDRRKITEHSPSLAMWVRSNLNLFWRPQSFSSRSSCDTSEEQTSNCS